MKNILEKIKLPIILGDGFFNKVKFLLYVFLFPLGRVLKIKFIPPKINLRYIGRSFVFYPTDGSDIGVLRDIFLKKEYFVDNIDPKVIFDLGSNVGASVLYFKTIFPNAKIYCFEPDPETFDKLKKNTMQFNGVYLFNYAVSSKNGNMDFFSNKNSSISSSVYNRGGGLDKISVISKTLQSIVEENGIQFIDLLKIDIEGAEFSVFKEFKSFDLIGRVIGEFHEDLSGEKMDSFLSIFKDFKVLSNKKIYEKRYVFDIKHI